MCYSFKMNTYENDCSGFLLSLCCHNQQYQLILELVNETSMWMTEDSLNTLELENKTGPREP